MSYIVLARKYRPQKFDEVYAQEHITTILKNAISLNRLAHAFLFTGSRGVGKTSMARILAKSLNCMEGISGNPCGVCDNCAEITNGTSTDVVEIDGASNTGVEDIRDLQKELMYSTSKSRYKIFIIDEVHMLSKNAFNALLKTLEEPPEQVLFIFATTEPHKVLPTIISRCQRYDFKRIPAETIVKRLSYICEKEGISIEEKALYVVAKKAEGSMRDALSLTDQLIATSKNNITMEDVLTLFGIVHTEVFHQITEYIHKKEPAKIVGMIHDLLDKGNDLQEFLGGYLDYLRNLLLTKTKVPLPELHPTLVNDLQKIETLFSEDTILYLMAVLIKTKTDIKYFSNPILLAEMTFIKLCKMEEMKSIADLLKNWQCGETGDRQQAQKQPAKRVSTYKPGVSTTIHQTVKEAEKEFPKYDKLSIEAYNKEKDSLIDNLSKSFPVAASFFRELEPVKVEGEGLFFRTNKKSAYNFLNSEKRRLSEIVSKFFRMNVVLSFELVEEVPSDNNRSKIIHNPTMQDIERESPGLAEFIKLSGASVNHIKKDR